MMPRVFAWIGLGMLFLLTNAIIARAEVVLDGSVGTSPPMTQVPGPEYNITQEMGEVAGTNLFHSFHAFSVDEAETATFSGISSIQNIISRVTNGAVSRIDGTLRSTISGADMFLLNPAGVIFGPGASLDISGSFSVSTADYIKMGQADRFYTAPQAGEDILSLSGPVSGFGFLDDTPGEIRFEGAQIPAGEYDGSPTGLVVPENETISVIGGDITFERGHYVYAETPLGNLVAESGRIDIASVSGAGEVTLNPDGIDMTSPGGNVSISAQSLIRTSGEAGGKIFIRGGAFFMEKSVLENDTQGGGPGGSIHVEMEDIHLEKGRIYADAFSTGNGGYISLFASNVLSLVGASQVFSDAAGHEADSGSAGTIRLSGNTVFISEGSFVSSDTYGGGRGGEIYLTGEQGIEISGSKVFTGAVGEGEEAGDAGAVHIRTPGLSLLEDAIVSSDTYYGSGKGGDILIRGIGSSVCGHVIIDGSAIYAGAVEGEGSFAGSGGTVMIEAGNVSFRNGGKIGSESIGAGDGGDVRITANGRISFSGTNEKGEASRIYTTALGETFAAGNAGNIDIVATNLVCTSGGGITASTRGPGNGGTIRVKATEGVTIQGENPHGENREGIGSGIYARSESLSGSAGDAGNLFIETGYLSLSGGGRITNSTQGQGMGGRVEITSFGNVEISGKADRNSAWEPLSSQVAFTDSGAPADPDESGIYSRSDSTGNGGNAGSITLSAAGLSLSSNGVISTSTAGKGGAGDIVLSVPETGITNWASISSESESENEDAGNAGSVYVQNAERIRMASGGAITTASSGGGNAGLIHLDSRNLKMDPGTRISSESLSPGAGGDAGAIHILSSSGAADSVQVNNSIITTSTRGQGNAGKIDIQSRSVELVDHGKISSESLSKGDGGNAGSIFITGAGRQEDLVLVENESAITTDAKGKGAGGDILVDTGMIRLAESSGIAAAGVNGGAGDVSLIADSVFESAGMSFVSTSTSGSGDAGKVAVVSEDIRLTEEASVTSQTTGEDTGGNAGAIEITGARQISLTGKSLVSTSSANTGDAGAVFLNAQTITTDNSIVSSAGESTGTGEFAGGNSGQIEILGSNGVSLTNASLVSTSTKGLGNAGDIRILSGNITVSGNTEVSSSSLSPGSGGDAGGIIFKGIADAADEVTIGDGSAVSTKTRGKGDAGTIDIGTLELELSGNSEITSSSTSDIQDGDAGSIHIHGVGRPSRLIRLMEQSSVTTESHGPGKGGDILFSAEKVIIGKDCRVSAEGNMGGAGTLSLVLEGEEGELVLEEGGTLSTSTNGEGDAGAIDLVLVRLVLENGATISSTSNSAGAGGDAGAIFIRTDEALVMKEKSAVTTSTKGLGNAGDIKVSVYALDMDTGSVIASSSDAAGDGGNAGSIAVNTVHSVLLQNKSDISTSTNGLGNAGAITIVTPFLHLADHSVIESSSNSQSEGGEGGSITVRGPEWASQKILAEDYSGITTQSAGNGNAGGVSLSVRNLSLTSHSYVSSSSESVFGTGNAGIVSISAGGVPSNTISLDQKANITTSARGFGKGGDIDLMAENLTLFGSSGISASGNQGDAGSVSVSGPEGSNIFLSKAGRITTESTGKGNAGNIDLAADSLGLEKGSEISSASLFAGDGGKGGRIRVKGASGAMHFADLSEESAITTKTLGNGDAGGILLFVNQMTLADHSQVSSSSEGTEGKGNAGLVCIGDEDNFAKEIRLSLESEVTTRAKGYGEGGNVDLYTHVLALDNASSVSASGNHGDAGRIFVYSGSGENTSIGLSNTGRITTESTGKGGAGDIDLYADAVFLSSTSEISSASLFAKDGGNAGTIRIQGANGFTETVKAEEESSITTKTLGNGDAGGIFLLTKALELDGNSSVSSSSEGETASGNAGKVAAGDARTPVDNILLSDESKITTQADGYGKGGNIDIFARNLTLTEASGITAAGNHGDAGEITLAGENTLLNSLSLSGKSKITTQSNGAGDAGNIAMNTLLLTLSDASEISSASLMEGDGGNAGRVLAGTKSKTIEAILLTGESGITTKTLGNGDAGAIMLFAGNLRLENASSISSSAEGQDFSGNAGSVQVGAEDAAQDGLTLSGESKITTQADGYGKGGNIDIFAKKLTLTEASGITAAGNHGDAGEITLAGENTLLNSLSLSGKSKITTQSNGAGDAGNIAMNTLLLTLSGGSEISSASLMEGDGGNGGRVLAGTKSKTIEAILLTGESGITTKTLGNGDAGAILLFAGNLRLENASSISSSAEGQEFSGNAGRVQVGAEDAVSEDAILLGESRITTQADGYGKGGNIDLFAGKLTLTEASGITAAGNHGDAGMVGISGGEESLSLVLMEGKSKITTESRGRGNAGDLGIITLELALLEESQISSASTSEADGGKGGRILISGNKGIGPDIRLSQKSTLTTKTLGKGDAGEIEISAKSLSLGAGSHISSSSENPGGTGNAGRILLGRESAPVHEMTITGTSGVNTSSKGQGKGGDIRIFTETCHLSGSSEITATGNHGDAGSILISGGSIPAHNLTIQENSRITTESKGEGNAGKIDLEVYVLDMNTGALISSSSESRDMGGDGGEIQVQAVDLVMIQDEETGVRTETKGRGSAGTIRISGNEVNIIGNAGVSSQSTKAENGGDAGSIYITADKAFFLNTGGKLTTEAVSAGGGQIRVHTEGDIRLKNGFITSSVQLGAGNGGDMDILSDSIIVDQSEIRANAYEGRGGNIYIAGNPYIQSGDSVVSASSKLGIDGDIEIESPAGDVMNAMVALPRDFLEADQWVVRTCEERQGETAGRFVILNRQGVPLPFDDFIPSTP